MHVDSWDVGVIDNGVGNVILLELVCIFLAHRDELRRGICFLFWLGYLYGCYVGFCWYVDYNWTELYERVVIAMSIDLFGTKGVFVLGGAKVMDEVIGVVTEVAELVVGYEVFVLCCLLGGE